MCKVASKCKAHYRPQCKHTQNKLSTNIAHSNERRISLQGIHIWREVGVKTGIWSLGMLLVSSRAAEEVTKLPTQETTIAKKKMQQAFSIYLLYTCYDAYIDIITLDHGGMMWQVAEVAMLTVVVMLYRVASATKRTSTSTISLVKSNQQMGRNGREEFYDVLFPFYQESKCKISVEETRNLLYCLQLFASFRTKKFSLLLFFTHSSLFATFYKKNLCNSLQNCVIPSPVEEQIRKQEWKKKRFFFRLLIKVYTEVAKFSGLFVITNGFDEM